MDVVPVITHTAWGSCIAMSPDSFRFRIAVVGTTEEDARSLFDAAAAEWEALSDERTRAA